VQEFLLAREVRILCGAHWLSPWDLRYAGLHTRNFPPSDGRNCAVALITESNEADENGNIAPQVKENQAQTRAFVNCIAQFTKNGCEDPRDKVYRLLGLCDGHHHIEVDYTKPVWKVYYEPVHMMIKERRDSMDEWAESTNKPAWYKIRRAALALAENMGMPKDLFKDIYYLPREEDWLDGIVSILEKWI
jgi:hypothetical protein